MPDDRRAPGARAAPRRGLLVDYGGVLTTSVVAAFRTFCEEQGLPLDVARDALRDAYGSNAAPGPIHDVETGRIGAEEFAAGLAATLTARAGTAVAAEGLLQGLFAGVVLDDRMVTMVARARAASVRTGLVSNSWGESGYARERFDELFDTVVISGEVGLRKPYPEIYELAARRLGLAPQACVFVDDLPPNVDGAEAVGMAGIVHRTADETIPCVADLLGLPAGALDG